MLTGPAPASRKALAKAGLTVDDIDLFEINEAFAAVAMRYMKDMGISHEQTNVNGGSIAMGHPLGATGAMILGTLIDELERRDLRTGPRHPVRGRRHGDRDDRGACLTSSTSLPSFGAQQAQQNGSQLGEGRRRHRHRHPRRPRPQRQHDERPLPGGDGHGRRPSWPPTQVDHAA